MVAEAETLRSWLDRVPVPVPEDLAIEWGRQLARQMAMRRRLRMSHQEVCLTNIFIGADANVHVGAPDDEYQGPAWRIVEAMACRQDAGAERRPQLVRQRSVNDEDDVYSWGQVMYEILADRPPFAAVTRGPVLDAPMRDEPVPLAWYRPDVSPAFEAVVMAALRRDTTRPPMAGPESLPELNPAETTPDGLGDVADRNGDVESQTPKWWLAVAAVLLVLPMVVAAVFGPLVFGL